MIGKQQIVCQYIKMTLNTILKITDQFRLHAFDTNY